MGKREGIVPFDVNSLRDASASGVFGNRIEICVADQAKRITRVLGPSFAEATEGKPSALLEGRDGSPSRPT